MDELRLINSRLTQSPQVTQSAYLLDHLLFKEMGLNTAIGLELSGKDFMRLILMMVLLYDINRIKLILFLL